MRGGGFPTCKKSGHLFNRDAVTMGRGSKLPGWAKTPRKSGLYFLAITREDGSKDSVEIDGRAGYLMGRSKKVIKFKVHSITYQATEGLIESRERCMSTAKLVVEACSTVS